MILVAEAQARLLALAPALALETVPLTQAAGRWASAPIIARRTQPEADLSAMDGYAIRFADMPGPWTVVGEAAAGGVAMRALGEGEAARIFTGAALPSGADAILIQEEAARAGDRLSLAGDGPGAPGTFVRPRGGDFAEGATLVRAGERLTAARIGLAAAGGHATVMVHARPRIALLSTGDELVSPGEPGGLPASNGPMLAALLADLPSDVIDLGIVPDDLAALAAAIAAAEADILVTIGGASVGDRDLVRPALEAAGAALDFWKVAMRPGKPMFAGRIGGKTVLGLPGNPVSAFVTAELFLKPLIRAAMGAAEPLPVSRSLPLAEPLPANGIRADYVRARIAADGVMPLGGDSAALVPLAAADALIVRPPHAPPAARGDSAEILDIA